MSLRITQCLTLVLLLVAMSTEDSNDKVETGAYSPFGTVTQAGQVIEGQIRCTGAIMRMTLGGGSPELVAWGLRGPFAMAFEPDGQLYAPDNGTGDLLWAIMTGGWYGWPDYHGPRRNEGAHPRTGTGVLWRVTRNTAAQAGGQ